MKLIKRIFKIIKQIFYTLLYKQRTIRKRLSLRIKIKKIIRNHPKLKSRSNIHKEYLKESRKFLKQNFKGYKNTDWHYTYSTLNGIKDLEYIPEEIFFAFIEPALNDKSIRIAFIDKNIYSQFFEQKNLPRTIFKIINGEFYTDDFTWLSEQEAKQKVEELDEKLVLKPAILSGGGKNVIIKDARQILKILNTDVQYKTNSFILQKYVNQHEVLKQFHPSSLNTLRVLTARIKNKIIILSCYLRMGQNNSAVDNGVAGGIGCGIDEMGRLKETGYDMHLSKYKKHPDTGIAFEGIRIPGFKIVEEFCISNHKKFPHFTFISWDMGINESATPIFIEFNLSSQEIGTHQINNGPLFGKYTDFFINKYKKLS